MKKNNLFYDFDCFPPAKISDFYAPLTYLLCSSGNFSRFGGLKQYFLSLKTNRKDDQIKPKPQFTISGNYHGRLLSIIGSKTTPLGKISPHPLAWARQTSPSNYINNNAINQHYPFLKETPELTNQSGSNNISISATANEP